MRFKWYGTATLLFESGKTRLLIDPYDPPFAHTAPISKEEACSFDAILITHPHVDHFKDIDTFSQGKLPVYVSEIGIQLARKNGLNYTCMQSIAVGDVLSVGNFLIRVYPASHCKFDIYSVFRILFSPRTWSHLPDCISLLKDASKFKIKSEDVLAFKISDHSTTVFVFGSAGMDCRAVYPTDVDLLIFPYQGRKRMDKVLIPFLQKIKPKTVTVDHFDDAFPPISTSVNLRRFLPTVTTHSPNSAILVPQPNIWYEI